MSFEVVLGIGGILVGLVFYFKNKADKTGSDAILNDTRGQDKILKETQEEVKGKILQFDQNIENLKKELDHTNDPDKSRQERADEWKK